jgi:hypothetical protein
MSHTPPRYVPDLPLPPYAYVPGRFPHPTRDPGGHRHGAKLAQPERVDPARWRDCRCYLAGIDLFNHGYYWEAHEAWESAWHASGRKGVLGDFLRGLIKLAAAGCKARENRPHGMRRLASGAAAHFARVAGALAPPASFMGFRPDELSTLAEAVAQGRSVRDAPSDARVSVVFDFVLRAG